MPPFYDWRDLKSGKTVPIIRPFEQHTETPTLEEAEKEGMTAEEHAAADWQKDIGGGIRVIKGRSWGGSKGNW